MTKLLAQTVRHVYAVELDDGLYEMLKLEYAGSSRVDIFHGDILNFDLSAIISKEKKRLVVFGNIPYYITTPIIEYLMRYRQYIDTIFLTIQKEVADRVCAVPGSKIYGSLSCFVQYYCSVSRLVRIPRGCFYPIPKVDSCCIALKVLHKPSVKVIDEQAMFRIIRTSFQQRRKTLKNSLSGIIPEDVLGEFFSARGLDSRIRPEQLSLSDFAALADMAATTS